MIGKKINQLATELAPVSTDLTIIGDPTTGVSKKITLAQLGAIFSGAVAFYTNLAGFPATGSLDIIYCAKDTQKLYLWSGSAYVEVFPSQALLDTYQLRSEKGNANGYASLDSQGKVPISQLPSSIMEYKGTWNASTNTPTLANGTGDTGDVYICNVAGTVNFGAGPLTFAVGDYVIYSGTIWQRSSGAVGTVTSVAVSRSGDALAITGSPVTTSGTINIGFAGNSTQYINGAGNLVTFPGVINEAQNLITEVYNKTGATLTKGTVVYINGGQGNLPAVTKALATGDSTSAQTYGIVRNDITNNNNGYVVVAGRISDLDTQAFTEGTQLYLSPTTAGTFTSTKPYAPQHLVYVGIVVRAHPTQGVIEVKIQNGYEMDELHNVAAQSPSNGDILQYVSATSLWTKTAGTTTNIAEGSNLYYTDARSRAALSFAAGSGAYNSTTGVITIPTNTSQLTNGANFITLASLSGTAPIQYNNTTGAISITQAGTSSNGFLSSTDWNTFNNKQNALTNPVTGTGTTNYLPKFTGTSTIGNSLVFDNGTNVGIGTAIPIYTFHTVSANTSIGAFRNNGAANGQLLIGNTVGDLALRILASGDAIIFSDTSKYLAFGSNGGSERMRLNASGNLSIGNTNDTYKLDVQGTAVIRNDGAAFQLLSSSTSTQYQKWSNGGGNYFVGISSSAGLGLLNSQNAYSFCLQTESARDMSFGTNNLSRMTIFSDGNVGINTGATNAGFKLDVNGTGRFSGALSANSFIPTSSSVPTNGMYLSATNTLGFATNSTLRATLDASGNLMVGGTSVYAATITSYGSATRSGGIGIRNSAGTVAGFFGTYASGSGSGSTDIFAESAGFMAFSSGGSERLRITSGGDVLVAGTYNPFASSNRGNITLNGSSGNVIGFANGSAIRGFIYHDGTNLDISNTTSNSILFSTNGSEKMRITSGGLVGIGTTAPNSPLEVNKTITFSNIDTYAQLVVKTTSGANGKLLNIGVDETNSVSFIQSLNRGTDAMPLSLQRYGGAVLIGTTTEGALGKLQVAGSVAITGQYNTVLPSSSFSYFDGSGQVVSSASSASALYLDTTWNTTGNPDGIYLNVTNTASGASSKLLNLKVGNASQFSVSKAGAIQTTAPSSGSAQPWKLGSYAAGGTGTATGVIYIEINGQIYSIPALQGTP